MLRCCWLLAMRVIRLGELLLNATLKPTHFYLPVF